MMEGHHHMTPTVQWRTIYDVKQLVPNNQAQGAQAPTTNINATNNQIQFQNNQRHAPSTTGPTGQCDNRYSQPSNKGPGKEGFLVILIHSLLFQIFSHEPVHTHRAET